MSRIIVSVSLFLISILSLERISENKETVQTIDIDHFWEAFDNLKNSKTRNDSIDVFQKIYLDRASDGLKEFIAAREFTAEKFVDAVAKFPKFYNSVRSNTIEIKKATPVVEETVTKLKQLYPNFKPFKVCFAIGLVNTGGTVSDNFLLIGAEISGSTKATDISEFNNSAYSRQLASGTNVTQKIQDIVAHEYVHTQQSFIETDPNAITCPLLYDCLREGAADFVGELTSGGQINTLAHVYGNKNEDQIWQEFKNELCSTSSKNWLYNYASVKDRPADLGYYVGYKITEAYYNKTTDKSQAIIDIIEMNDPLKFLKLSGYDGKK